MRQLLKWAWPSAWNDLSSRMLNNLCEIWKSQVLAGRHFRVLHDCKGPEAGWEASQGRLPQRTSASSSWEPGMASGCGFWELNHSNCAQKDLKVFPLSGPCKHENPIFTTWDDSFTQPKNIYWIPSMCKEIGQVLEIIVLEDRKNSQHNP